MLRKYLSPARFSGLWFLALTLLLMPPQTARAQFGYGGYGWGYPGWGGYGWGWGGYGYPSVAYNYGYPFYGLGNIPITGNVMMGAPGYGYGGWAGMGGYGYGGYGYGGFSPYGLHGFGYAPGGIGLSGVGYVNPMFGAGLTPLGNDSFMLESRMLGRVPRAPVRYYETGYRRW